MSQLSGFERDIDHDDIVKAAREAMAKRAPPCGIDEVRADISRLAEALSGMLDLYDSLEVGWGLPCSSNISPRKVILTADCRRRSRFKE